MVAVLDSISGSERADLVLGEGALEERQLYSVLGNSFWIHWPFSSFRRTVKQAIPVYSVLDISILSTGRVKSDHWDSHLPDDFARKADVVE